MTLKQIENSDAKTITDPLLEPFYIAMDEYNYIVQEVVTPNPKYSETGKKYVRPVGYFSTLPVFSSIFFFIFLIFLC